MAGSQWEYGFHTGSPAPGAEGRRAEGFSGKVLWGEGGWGKAEGGGEEVEHASMLVSIRWCIRAWMGGGGGGGLVGGVCPPST